MTDSEHAGPGGRPVSPMAPWPDPVGDIHRATDGHAAGGWCAPIIDSRYDFVDLTPWTHPDLPWTWNLDIEEWLFPRWTEWERTWSDLPRRCRVAWRVLRIGYSHHQEPH